MFVTPDSFFFTATATTEISTLSLHDALPICSGCRSRRTGTCPGSRWSPPRHRHLRHWWSDRKSTRLNSSHSQISYAVFCLKKKNTNSTVKHLDSYENSLTHRRAVFWSV